MNLQNNNNNKNGTLYSRMRSDCGNLKSWITIIDKFPFEVKRFFYLDVPGGVCRGDHAHKKCKQLFVCVTGQFRIRTQDGLDAAESFILNSDDYYLNDSMEWTNIRAIEDEDNTGSSILLVFCSEEYDEDDYIRNFDEFQTLAAEKVKEVVDNLVVKPAKKKASKK